MLARTDTPRLLAFADQTQTTKTALCPALTSLAPESGWIRTHSCGVTRLGFGLGELEVGLGELGLGLGLAELEVWLGDGLVVADVDDETLDGDDDAGDEPDVEGLEEGLLLAEVRDVTEALGEPDVVDDAEVLADRIGDADELASAAPGRLLADRFVAAESTVLFGISGHAALMLE